MRFFKAVWCVFFHKGATVIRAKYTWGGLRMKQTLSCNECGRLFTQSIGRRMWGG